MPPHIPSEHGIDPKPIIDIIAEAYPKLVPILEVIKILELKALTCEKTANFLSEYIGSKSRARDMMINASIYADIRLGAVASRRGKPQAAFTINNIIDRWFVYPQAPLHSLRSISCQRPNPIP
ncbi:hypothetical protein CF326_g5733 [Tilletia indica]|nr:hypothetical protein CF326_g5733 [Tilletia indica]